MFETIYTEGNKMKGKMKFAFAAVFLAVFMVCTVTASSVSAAEFIVQNSLDDDVSMAFTYFNRATGLWTTEGWWGVDGNDEMTLNINNIDTSKKVFYVGMVGKTFYLDKSQMGSPTRRWITDKPFKFDSPSDKKPNRNAYSVSFYECKYSEGAGGYVIRINTRPVG
jgi:hypothetical protein